jgi:hypothetical protein
MKNLLFLMLIVIFSPVYSADKVDPLKIMREVYQRKDAKTLIQDMEMTSVLIFFFFFVHQNILIKNV